MQKHCAWPAHCALSTLVHLHGGSLTCIFRTVIFQALAADGVSNGEVLDHALEIIANVTTDDAGKQLMLKEEALAKGTCD